MLFLIWLVLCLFLAFLVILPSALWVRAIYRRYSGWRRVTCPENQQPAAVSVDAHYAAATGVHGLPALRLCDCTRWPERAQCGQPCLSQAAWAEPEASRPGGITGKRIYHLPIILAAVAAWCLGAFWHAQYSFRPRWMDALGLTHAQIREIRWWFSPHLLTFAACLLFAYGVAWLLAVCHWKGVLPGVLLSVVLGSAIIAANWMGLAGLPHDLLMIEAGYAVLAMVVVGATVGGLYDRLVLRPH